MNRPAEDLRARMWSYRAEVYLNDAEARQNHAQEAAQAATKAVFLANGAAILSLLTLIGNTNIEVDVRGIRWSFVWFSLGFFLSICAHFFRYKEAGYFTTLSRYIAVQLQHPEFAHDFEERKCASECEGNRFRWLTQSSAILSAFLFVVGAFVALVAIT